MSAMESKPQNEQPTVQKPRKKHLLLAAVLLIVGFLVLSAGASLWYYNLDTDNEGYVYSNIYHVNTTSYAFTAYMNEYSTSMWGWLGPENIAQIKYVVHNLNPTKELFTGYATTAQSEPYRQSFQCQIPMEWRWIAKPYDAEIIITTTTLDGSGAPASLPQTQTFWRTTASSSDIATMTYLPQHEQYIWFIMNSDGSAGVNADIQIGFKSPILMILPLVFLPVGIILVIAGVYLVMQKKQKPIQTS